jgi:hypothetical protein
MAEGAARSRAKSFPASAAKLRVSELRVSELRGLEPRTGPGKMGLELRFLSFGVVTWVLGFLRICVGVLRDVTVLDRLVWRPTARG